MTRRPPRSTLFPYPTLFRSRPRSGRCRHARGLKSPRRLQTRDRKSTRLNSSHLGISYAVFCLKKKTGSSPRRGRHLRRHVRRRQVDADGSAATLPRRQRRTLLACFNDTATTEIYTLSLHDALPIWFGLILAAQFRQRLLEILRLAEIAIDRRSEEHTSELQSLRHLVCRLLLEK